MSVAIIVIATAAYKKFFSRLRESINRHFLPGTKKTFLLFTDVLTGWPDDVVAYPALHMPWPLPSLLRFDRFLSLDLSKYDLVYFFDADQMVASDIHPNDVVPVQGQLVGVTHPNSHVARHEMFETNPASAAYCNPRLLGTYYHANFFGGHREDFLKMAEACSATVAKDLNSRYIAKWDDESHLNRYFAVHPPKTLPPTYGFPSHSTQDMPDKKIIHYAKDYGSLRAYRSQTAPQSRGVVLLAAGNPCYGQYAANLAASILQVAKEAKITLFATDSVQKTLSKEQQGYFDRIIPVPHDTLYVEGKPYYNRFKLYLPHISPYDETMYFDVDSLWVSKLPITELFDYFRVHQAPYGGQCEAVVPVNQEAVLFKGIKDLKPLEAFHPPLHFSGKNFYQIHGQCVYCTKTPEVKGIFEQALRLFDAMLFNKLTCTMYWVWHGQPIEELCLTLATGMSDVRIPEPVTKVAPVSVQSDGLTSIDPFSPSRFLISVNGYETYDEARKVGGYCMGEKETALYVGHYNRRIDELKADGYEVSHYTPKIVEL